ncbi:MAG TPA: YciI family protein [Dehalococcoidia bacterium]|nr:YciI family protein [Dehalococcoidia bacterium]
MKYLLLIYRDESVDEGPDPLPRYVELIQEARQRGAFISAEPLHPVATATSVRVRRGRTETIDGPFAETKEQLGGFYLLDCTDLDEAIRYAAKIPAAEIGTIEVRPVQFIEELQP